ncbi:hypothetical protein BDY24DRAFT_201298 [Mrakia frigida]|uniref:uncharacterized protein n=1 Tax=Mrakia frigida TaxID=29902 RepID=UPI003FCC14CD
MIVMGVEEARKADLTVDEVLVSKTGETFVLVVKGPKEKIDEFSLSHPRTHPAFPSNQPLPGDPPFVGGPIIGLNWNGRQGYWATLVNAAAVGAYLGHVQLHGWNVQAVYPPDPAHPGWWILLYHPENHDLVPIWTQFGHHLQSIEEYGTFANLVFTSTVLPHLSLPSKPLETLSNRLRTLVDSQRALLGGLSLLQSFYRHLVNERKQMPPIVLFHLPRLRNELLERSQISLDPSAPLPPSVANFLFSSLRFLLSIPGADSEPAKAVLARQAKQEGRGPREGFSPCEKIYNGVEGRDIFKAAYKKLDRTSPTSPDGVQPGLFLDQAGLEMEGDEILDQIATISKSWRSMRGGSGAVTSDELVNVLAKFINCDGRDPTTGVLMTIARRSGALYAAVSHVGSKLELGGRNDLDSWEFESLFINHTKYDFETDTAELVLKAYGASSQAYFAVLDALDQRRKLPESSKPLPGNLEMDSSTESGEFRSFRSRHLGNPFADSSNASRFQPAQFDASSGTLLFPRPPLRVVLPLRWSSRFCLMTTMSLSPRLDLCFSSRFSFCDDRISFFTISFGLFSFLSFFPTEQSRLRPFVPTGFQRKVKRKPNEYDDLRGSVNKENVSCKPKRRERFSFRQGEGNIG